MPAPATLALLKGARVRGGGGGHADRGGPAARRRHGIRPAAGDGTARHRVRRRFRPGRRALPGLGFVLDHLAKAPIASGELEPWAGLVRELAAEPNVTAKLSGLITEAAPDRWDAETLRPYVGVALDAFGPERLMYGSDWPVCLLAGSLPAWTATALELLNDAGLSAAERDAVFQGTATRVYGLSG
nr:amidohydrolase family protein [Sphaerisporangium album]